MSHVKHIKDDMPHVMIQLSPASHKLCLKSHATYDIMSHCHAATNVTCHMSYNTCHVEIMNCIRHNSMQELLAASQKDLSNVTSQPHIMQDMSCGSWARVANV